jgi:aminoglycoside phosphotransferase (APT) family kinase protein
VEFPDDERLRVVLSALRVSPEDLLGHGGEAWVYALGDRHVVRLLHEGQDGVTIRLRQALVEELRSGGAPFDLPEVVDVGEVDGRWFAIERRLMGVRLMDQLAALEGHERDLLVERHLDAAALLGTLHLSPRGWYGELVAGDPVRSATWLGYLRERAAVSLRQSTPSLHAINPTELADALPDATIPAFVHLDAFAGNMLATRTAVTAVLDIGPTSVSGDSRLDPLAAAVYLSAPQITPVATSRDLDVAMSWLRSAGLVEWFAPAKCWLAAFWSLRGR